MRHPLSSILLIAALTLAALAVAQETPAPEPEADVQTELAPPTPPVPPRPPRPVRPMAPGVAEAPDLPPDAVTRLIPVRHVPIDDVLRLLQPYAENSLVIQTSEELEMLSVSGSAEAIDRFEMAVRSLDVPDRDLELLVFVLRGSQQPDSSVALPPELGPTLQSLKTIFPFASFTPVDTVVLRMRSGSEAVVTDTVSLAEGLHLEQQVKASVRLVDDPAAPLVRVEEFEYACSLIRPPAPQLEGAPRPPQRPSRPSPSATFTASLTVPPGQGALVGKVDLGEPDSVLFVIALPRVIGTAPTQP